jgi:hypothetical protein
MDALLNAFGGGAFWPVLQGGGLLAVVAMVLRARALHRLDELGRAIAARRRVRDIGPGLTSIAGRWRRLDERRGLVEDDSGTALVVFADGHAGTPPAAGAAVVVVALGGGLVDDPRGAGYRSDARLPQLAVVDPGHFVRLAGHDALDRARVVERAAALLFGALFALGLGLAATAVVVALRVSGS